MDCFQPGAQPKRSQLDSGEIPETSSWSYASMNKPVGIAQPFPKSGESVSNKSEEQECDEMSDLKEATDITPVDIATDHGLMERTKSSRVEPTLGDEALEWSSMVHGRCDEHRVNSPGRINLCGERAKAPVEVPTGRKYHVFVTHSTSDQQWAECSIVTPLSRIFVVKACYQLMPNKSQYNDLKIKDSMKQSCVILIGLSPAYINSSRCKKEWQLARSLSQKVKVVVAAVTSCSRPEPLKCFLYLDFIDKEKRKTVWDMLISTVESTVRKMLAEEQERSIDLDLHAEMSSASHSRNDMQIQEESTQMIADFEAQWDASSDSYQETKGLVEVEDRLDSHDHSMMSSEEEGAFNDVSTDVANMQSVNEDEQAHTDDSEGSSETKSFHANDVEDGEISDSSGDVNKDDQKPSDVASFYNNLARPDADKRNESPIKLMRNFNNWVKSVLIRSYLKLTTPGSTALDICCGKGGDLLKWKEGRIKHLVCADISDESINAAQERFHSDKMTGRGRLNPPFTADFYVADCTKTKLTELQKSPVYYHLTSCQFSVHYSFESYSNAHMMLRNACENLRPGGYFIGTTIDADNLVYRLQTSSSTAEDGSISIGNDLFTVTLDSSLDVFNLPLFNARYNFRLHGVVDLPEYLVYFPLLVKMLEPFEMELILRQNFYDFFEEHRYNSDDADLLYRMEAFDKSTGTMSQEQWEIVGLYLVFVFKKKCAQ